MTGHVKKLANAIEVEQTADVRKGLEFLLLAEKMKQYQLGNSEALTTKELEQWTTGMQHALKLRAIKSGFGELF